MAEPHTPMKLLARSGIFPAALIVIFLAGCGTDHYRKSADRAAYGAIRGKTPLVRNMDTNFTIDQTNVISLDPFPISTNVMEFLGTEGESERGARVIKLADALDIGIHHSRNYQASKEDLFLSALDVTFSRHEFTPIFSANVAPTYKIATIDQEVEKLVGTNIVISEKLVADHSVTGDGLIDVSWLIRDIGRITAAFTADFTRFVTGDPRFATGSRLTAAFTRPLLRNAGFKNETEALTQSERDLLYDLRDFTQFRKDFSVRIATAYYGVLGSRDVARNSYVDLQTSRRNAERARAMAAEGRSTTAELGRLRQAELQAENGWISAIRSYKRNLDDFKLQLGLNVDANIVLDDRELEQLQILHPNVTVDDAIRIALAARFDYMNAKDRLEDSDRKLELAADALKPRVDLITSGGIESDPDVTGHFRWPDPKRYNFEAALDIDPGLDKTQERNSYRSALITRERAERSVEQREDEIKQQVRESWRTLEAAKRSYEISDIGVQVAERRVEEQQLLSEVGRAKAQDQVDAKNDLIDSLNARTQALVTHTIARLQFWNNMGILYIKDNGQWEEVSNAKIE